MKFAKLLHNPGAGDGGYSEDELVALIETAGFDCSYSSTKKKGWENIEPKELDLLILAGGDGTIRKVAEELLDKPLLDKKLPIGLLPLGTANNIAKTLGVSGNAEAIIKSWKENCHEKKFDVGRIYGLKKAKFFLESFGFGIFPLLMEAMEKQPAERISTPEKSIQTALKVLLRLVEKTEAKSCRIEIDGADFSGRFLLAEVMNTRLIGPNLHLAPFADPGDGQFDVVLIHEGQRQEFLDCVQKRIDGNDEPPFFKTLKAKKLSILWDGVDVHVDDEIIPMTRPAEVKIDLHPGLLEFLIPDRSFKQKSY